MQWTMATSSDAKISTREMRAMRTSGGMEKQETHHRRQVSANQQKQSRCFVSKVCSAKVCQGSALLVWVDFPITPIVVDRSADPTPQSHYRSELSVPCDSETFLSVAN
jgi:hypothetical protein